MIGGAKCRTPRRKLSCRGHRGVSVDNWRGPEGHPAQGVALQRGLQGPLAAQPRTVGGCYFGEQ